MAAIIEPYFAVVDITQIVGDKFNQAFTLEIDGVNFSFTDYTLSGKIVDRQGNDVTTFSFVKSTTTVADDTITVTALPANLPTKSGLYTFWIRYTETAVTTNVRTLTRGKITFVEIDQV